ncbi:hypothetical protein [Tropicibacter sp. S64]|uniref:hypothetical protein n=1 Tax=Tropicibacter sp. S64 TaxID=3415122 RepID=UPI003C7E1CFF
MSEFIETADMQTDALKAAVTWDIDNWNLRAPAEVGFWDRWITGRGDKWPGDFRRRTDPDAPLTPLVLDLLPHLDLDRSRPVKMLDIGSGPLSYVGYTHPEYEIDLTVVDPLSQEYNRLLDSVGITGVPRTQPGYFETALADFGPEAFDLVWCFNSLDHSIDPIIGLFNLLSVIRIGGGLIFSFCPNEAEHGKYKGLHQWNLDVTPQDGLILTQMGRTVRLQGLIDQQRVVLRHVSDRNDKQKARATFMLRKVAHVNLSQAMLA